MSRRPVEGAVAACQEARGEADVGILEVVPLSRGRMWLLFLNVNARRTKIWDLSSHDGHPEKRCDCHRSMKESSGMSSSMSSKIINSCSAYMAESRVLTLRTFETVQDRVVGQTPAQRLRHTLDDSVSATRLDGLTSIAHAVLHYLSTDESVRGLEICTGLYRKVTFLTTRQKRAGRCQRTEESVGIVTEKAPSFPRETM